jgi:hypothetical protein
MFNLFYQNSSLRNSLAGILVITTIFSIGGWVLFYPNSTQAQFGGGAADIIGGPYQIEQTVWDKVKFGIKQTWNTIDKAFQKIQTAIAVWEKSDRLLVRAAAAAAEIALVTILNMLTNEIIKWIQGGGEPRFVTNWQDFLKDAADKVGGEFVDQYLGAGWLCEPFDLDIKIALLDVPTFDERVRCTISDIVENINTFYDDFSKGGWAGWIELTKPRNNFYGAYHIALEEKLKLEALAKEAAGQEAIAGRGFLSPKVCVRGHLEDMCTGYDTNTCNNKDSCYDLKDTAKKSNCHKFVCDKEVASTPASVISDVVSRAADRNLELLQDQIADLTDSKGILAPYITAIGHALINRIMKEGLAFITESGPTIDKPSRPIPAGRPVYQVDQTPAQVTQTQASATSLLKQQKLLKENLETQLLSQQQSNLSVMQSIESTQTNILTTLKDTLAQNCPLPSWANTQTISTTENTETIQITASGIGTILIEKTTVSETTTYQIKKTIPQITNQITALEKDIEQTNQWIADTAKAITSTNGYIQAADDYLTLYQQTLQPPTAEEQAALDQKKQAIEAAKNLAISDGQKAAQSSSTDLEQLDKDTQDINITVNQTTNNLLQARGISQEYPQHGTLYDQKKSLQTKLSQVQSNLLTCSTNI